MDPCLFLSPSLEDQSITLLNKFSNNNAGLSHDEYLAWVFFIEYGSAFLYFKDLMALSVVSSSLFVISGPHIQSSITFRWWKRQHVRAPKKIITKEIELPVNITHLTFCANFNKPILSLPPSLSYLHFGNKFNQIVENKLPLSLSHLIFGKQFSNPTGELPPSLIFLSFANHYCFPVSAFPKTLTHLKYRLQVHDSVLSVLPDSLTHFSIGKATIPIVNLPQGLKRLYLGGNFNQALYTLPSSLTDLQIDSYQFMHPLPPLPAGLKRLKLRRYGGYLSPSSNIWAPFFHVSSLSRSLELLHTGDDFKYPTCFYFIFLIIFIGYYLMDDTLPVSRLPASLTDLNLGRHFGIDMESKDGNILHLSNLKTLTVGRRYHFTVRSLPPSLTHITFGSGFNSAVDNLPSSLTHLVFGYHFNKSVDCLPPSLSSLIFGARFDQPINHLPPSLTHLSFKSQISEKDLLDLSHFNQPVDLLPASIISLCFGLDFNQSVDSLPLSLKSLSFDHKFNSPVDRLPPSLTSLSFGTTFNQPVDNLPSSLLYLSFGNMFNQPVFHLPPGLIKIRFGSDFLQPVNHLRPLLSIQPTVIRKCKKILKTNQMVP